MKSTYRLEIDKIDNKQKIIEMFGLGCFCALPVLVSIISKYVPIELTQVITVCVIVAYSILTMVGIYIWYMLEKKRDDSRKLMNNFDVFAENIADDVLKK